MSDGNSPSSDLEERLKLHEAHQKPILGPRGVLDKMRTSDCVLSGPTIDALEKRTTAPARQVKARFEEEDPVDNIF